MVCDASSCTTCNTGYGPDSGNACKACTSTAAGLKTCASDGTTATSCTDGYGVISGVC